jgi:hypothetical protein
MILPVMILSFYLDASASCRLEPFTGMQRGRQDDRIGRRDRILWQWMSRASL